jgi:hypothetical protein
MYIIQYFAICDLPRIPKKGVLLKKDDNLWYLKAHFLNFSSKSQIAKF